MNDWHDRGGTLWAADERTDAVSPAAEPLARPRAGSRRERRDPGRRPLLVVLVVVALVLGVVYVVASVLDVGSSSETATSQVAAVDDFPGPGHGSATVVVGKGDDAAAIGRALVDAGVVADADVFATAFARHGDSDALAPGTYRIALELPAAAAVDALLDPAARVSLRITIPEGLTASQVLAKISEKTTVPLEDLQDAADDAKAIGLPSQADGEIEGWVRAGTFEVDADADATSILRELVGSTVDLLESRDVPKDDWQDTLVVASLVQADARLDEYRPKIARAILNCVAMGQPLRIPASVSYGEGVSGAPTSAMIADSSNPYNTFTHAGLPPTPIAGPSEASIDAVLDPADGSWLFWDVVDPETGETLFSETWEDHLTNVDKLRAWQDENETDDETAQD